MASADLLKFITCGSVDDGKSTLIGHMLYDAKLIFTDQEKSLELDSKVGSTDGKIDYSLLLDGLMAEREQGITIDVAYRYFTTDKRSFIVADTPGHEEYTRNMAVGASFAQLSIILIDASQGILTQTRRHARICSMMGIEHFVFAINKMDLMDYSREVYQKISDDITAFMKEIPYKSCKVIPVSATEGDNVTIASRNMPWYEGPALLPYLENINVTKAKRMQEFVLPVQRVCRPNREFRGFQGQVAAGELQVGDAIIVRPSGERAVVRRIFVGDREVSDCQEGQPVTIQLDKEIDVSRGCIIEKNGRSMVGSAFVAKLLWMDDQPLAVGQNYWLKVSTQKVPATITHINHRIDVNTGDKLSADQIEKNQLVECEISVGTKTVMDLFSKSRELGSLILIDRVSHMTSACGVITKLINQNHNLTWQSLDITKDLRKTLMRQKSFTIWFTGLSGSGKSTIANALEKRLFAMGKHTMLLDGDNIRMGINQDLGFEERDRAENIRRIAHIAKLMNDAGLIVLTSFVSPYHADRKNAKSIIGEDFFEVFVDTPLEECEKRDVKGLYKKAREGKVKNFTGIDSPYEAPKNADIVLDTVHYSVEECVDQIIAKLSAYER